MILWTAWQPLPPAPSGSPKVKGLFVPVFAEVRKHDIIAYWYDLLGDSRQVSEYCEVVADGLESGAEEIFLEAAEGRRLCPSFDRMKGSLMRAFLFPTWIVYFLLAEPVDDPRLPTLGYVGSGTACAGQYTGGESRARGHLGNFRNGRRVAIPGQWHELTSSTQLFLYRAADGNVYKISVLVLWSSRFDFRTAADEEIQRRRRDVHVVESALATAMGVHSVKGSRTTVFDLPPATARFKPCNEADPLSAMQTMGYIQYQVAGLQRTLSIRDLTMSLLRRSGGQMELGTAELLHYMRCVVPGK